MVNNIGKMKMNMKVYRFIIFAGLFFSLVTVIIYFSNAPRRYINKINSAYKGIITEKYFKKVVHYKIKTINNEDLDIALLSDSLDAESAVGDSIEKIPNDNYVILTRNGRHLKIQYIYIPNSIRNDSRWPEKWKDKWIIPR